MYVSQYEGPVQDFTARPRTGTSSPPDLKPVQDFTATPKTGTRFHRQTDLFSIHANHRHHSVAKQTADQIAADLAELWIVVRDSRKRQNAGDNEKNASDEICSRLVGDESVDVAAEMSTCKE